MSSAKERQKQLDTCLQNRYNTFAKVVWRLYWHAIKLAKIKIRKAIKLEIYKYTIL